jgi:predicted peptidase
VGSSIDTVAMPVNCLLYLPPDYSRRSKWPLVVYLHGSGSRGFDLNLVRREGPVGVVARGKKFSFILLSPQCPARFDWNPKVVVDLIEHISSSLSVDRDRVYLTGYSMGGFGAWRIAAYDPKRFAAVAPLAGSGDVGQAKRLVDVPIWAFHGAKDQVVPLKTTEAMVDAVRKYGGQVRLTVYPNGGHGICWQIYQDEPLYDWLLAQRRSSQ